MDILENGSKVVYHPYHTRKVGGTTITINRHTDVGRDLEEALFKAVGGRSQAINDHYAFTVYRGADLPPLHVWVIVDSIVIGSMLLNDPFGFEEKGWMPKEDKQ